MASLVKIVWRAAYAFFAAATAREEATGPRSASNTANSESTMAPLLRKRAMLASTNWLPLATILGDGAEQSTADTNAVALQRFYRMRVEP